MRLALLSDIHVGTGGSLPRDLRFVLPLGKHASRADAWILLGDIGEPSDGHGLVSLEMALSELGKSAPCVKGLVAGNHDLAFPIISDRCSDEFFRRDWPLLARKHGYTPLDHENLIVPSKKGAVGIAGSLGPIARHQDSSMVGPWDMMRIHIGRTGLERCQGQRSMPEERKLFDAFDAELLLGFRSRLRDLERDAAIAAIVVALHIPPVRTGEASSEGWLDAVSGCGKVVAAVFGDAHQSQGPFHAAGVEWIPTRSAPHAPATLLLDVEPGKHVVAWRWMLGRNTRPKRLPIIDGRCHDDFPPR